ncbi:MAG: hypothetical protein GY861_17740 [bacterium]|nr:hypothetical protein [bacterium]
MYITTPANPMSPGSINSPYYNPTTSEQYKTPVPAYSPIIEREETFTHNTKHPNSPYSPSSPLTYTPNANESILTKSPFIQQGASSKYGASSNTDSQNPNNTYSPSNIPNIGSFSRNNVPSYRNTTSPGYSHNMNSQGNYSPSTSMYNKNSVSPDYTNSGFRNSSHYSGGSSPRVQESGGSPGSQQQYSPKSPIYNAKSPSYGMKLGNFLS